MVSKHIHIAGPATHFLHEGIARSAAAFLFAAALAFTGCAGGSTDDSLKPESLRLPAIMVSFYGAEETEIAPGDTYDFGQVDLDDTVSANFRIYNNGVWDLNIFDLSFSHDGPSPFSIDSPGSDLIFAGGYTTFTISYTPVEETGVQSELVYIINDDAENGGFCFRLSGNCMSPKKQPDVEMAINGRNGDDVISGLVVGADGSLYVAGQGYNLVNGSQYDWWIKKFSSEPVESELVELEFNGALTLETDECGDGDSPCTMNGSDIVHNGTPGGAASLDRVTGLAADGSGNVYVAGTGTNLCSASSGVDCWIKKFNSSGIEQAGWNKMLDGLTGTAGFADTVRSIAVDGAGNVYVAGDSTDSSVINRDWWIKKYDPDGNELSVTFNTQLHANTYKNNYAVSIAVDGDGNIYAGGYGWGLVRYPVFANPDEPTIEEWNYSSGYDWWVKKLNSDGTQAWLYTFGTNGGSDVNAISDALVSATLDYDETGMQYHLYLAGSGDERFMMKRLDGSGTAGAAWDKVFTNTGDYAEASAIAVADDGSVFVAGWYKVSSLPTSEDTNWWIKKFDSSGVEDAELWDLRLDYDGGGDRPAAIAAHGGFLYVAGWADDVDRNNDWWILRFAQ